MNFTHKTESRGTFEVELIEKGTEERKVYNDVRIKFSINITNTENPMWNIKFADVVGRIRTNEDKEKLITKVIEEIKKRIDMDQQGDFYIGEPTLDLT